MKNLVLPLHGPGPPSINIFLDQQLLCALPLTFHIGCSYLLHTTGLIHGSPSSQSDIDCGSVSLAPPLIASFPKFQFFWMCRKACRRFKPLSEHFRWPPNTKIA
ncbi:hypothetical protein GEMRC1_000796 [Eukaryota sp. GEM-RC1]